jgi:O-antigen/teichoic acid export membrane protein
VAFVVTNVLAALGAVLLLRHLGVSEFGRYGTVMALVNIVYGISDAGLSLTGSRELAVRSAVSERRQVLAHILGMRIVLTAFGVVAAIVFAVAAGYDHALVLGTALAGFGILLGAIQTAMLLPLSVELRNGRVALNDVLRQAVLVLTFGALVILGKGLVDFFAAQIVVGAVLLLATPWLLSREHFVAPRWSRRELRSLMTIAVPVAIANVLGVLYLRLLVVLMSITSNSRQEVGYYVTSTRIVELAAGLPFLLVGVVLPVMTVAARDDRERMGYITSRLTQTMAIGGILIVLFVSFAARPIVLVLGGSTYLGAVPVLQVQCLAMVTVFLASAWNPSLMGMGRVRALVATTATGLATVLVAGLVLIPLLHARGAAIAAVVADLALCLATYVALRRAGLGEHVHGRSLLRLVVAAAPAVAVGLVPGEPPIVAGLLAPAVFLGAALLLRAVPSELLGLVRGISQRFAHG